MKAVIPGLRTPNVLNGSHRHWAPVARRRKEQRQQAFYAARSVNVWPIWQMQGERVSVTITRVAPSRGLDPMDGLGAALKGVIDGVADALGLKDDRDPRVTWRLEQRRGQWAVEIEVQ